MFAIFFMESMDPFYENISSFPTVIFTFVLALSVLFWLISVLGFIEIEALDFDLPEADLDVDGKFTNPDVLAGLMLKFGLQGVPVTVIVSLISLFGWIICYYAVHFIFPFIPDGLFEYLAGLPIFMGSLYAAVLITSVLIKPLRPLFNKAQQETRKYVLGQTAVVRTSRVDDSFGEVILEDGGAGLIFKARSTEGVSFKKGDRVVLLDRDEVTNTYRVISEEEFRKN